MLLFLSQNVSKNHARYASQPNVDYICRQDVLDNIRIADEIYILIIIIIIIIIGSNAEFPEPTNILEITGNNTGLK